MLYFVAPDIFFFGAPITFGGTKPTVVTGARADEYEEETAQTTFSTRLNTAVIPDICIVARAHYLVARDTSPQMIITGATDSSFSLNAQNFTKNITENDLVGVENQDLIYEFTAAEKANWRVRFSTSVSVKQRISKVYLSRKFYLGREPEAPTRLRYISSSGNKRRQPREIALNYRGISAEKYADFKDLIVAYKATNPIFLYAKDDPTALAGETLIHAYLESMDTTSRMVNRFDISLKFIEIV